MVEAMDVIPLQRCVIMITKWLFAHHKPDQTLNNKFQESDMIIDGDTISNSAGYDRVGP